MEITELLQRQRKVYVDFFQEQISNCKGSSELLLESKIEEPEEYYRLYRFDCIKRKEADFEIIEFNNDAYINHKPIYYHFDELQIEINPFFWNGCEIDLYGEIANWGIFIEWVKEWIEDDSDKGHENGSLSYKIHNFQKPRIELDKIVLAIDLGTVATDALIQLIRIIEHSGIKKMRIHSDEMLKN